MIKYDSECIPVKGMLTAEKIKLTNSLTEEQLILANLKSSGIWALLTLYHSKSLPVLFFTV